MSSFEFILVSIAIVLGFGISEILAGWGRQLRRWQEVRPYPLQVVASAYLLSLSVRYLWTLWAFQGIEWRYTDYVLVFLPALLLALAAHLIRVDVESLRHTAEEQYFQCQRPLFVLLALFPLLGVANASFHAEHFVARFGSVAGPFLWVWPLSIAAFVWMGISRKPGHHWVGWAIVWLANGVISVSVLPTLGKP